MALTPTLPAFDDLSARLLDAGTVVTASDLHGMVVGRLSAGSQPDADSWQAQAADFLDLEQLPPELAGPLLELAAVSQAQLADQDLALSLLLPDEEDDLASRVQALGHWCHGFLSGFGSSGLNDAKAMSEDVIELLRDLTAIAQVGSQVDETEENEVDFTEVVEFVRMAVLNLHLEFGPRQQPQPGSPALH